MNTFVFELNEAVRLEMSGEHGRVIGRAEYAHVPPQYLVRYVAADGRQVEEWFDSTAIESA